VLEVVLTSVEVLSKVVLVTVLDDGVLPSTVGVTGLVVPSTVVGEEVVSLELQPGVVFTTGVVEGVLISVEMVRGVLLT
jgi:hypothetical protein